MGLKPTYPLSESQMGIVLEWIQHPDTTQNNISVQYDFPLDMDAERLCRAAWMPTELFPWEIFLNRSLRKY